MRKIMSIYNNLLESIRKNPYYYLALIVIFGYFIYRLFDLLLRLKFPVIPDEIGHFNLIELYSDRSLFQIYLENEPDIIRSTTTTRTPWLYYYLLGRAQNLNVSGISDFVFLRTVNIILAVCTTFIGLLMIRHLTKNKFFHISFIAIITNIPMLTFLSVGISYDNLANLIAALSILLVLVLNKRDTIIGWGSYVLVGLLAFLTKETLLPLILFETLLLIILKRKSIIRVRLGEIIDFTKTNKVKLIIISVLIVPLLLLVLDLHLRNLITYGSISPRCDEVISREICENNAIYLRGEKYRNAELPEKRSDFYHYLYTWKDIMSARILGVYSHSSVPKTLPLLAIYEISIIIATFGLIRYYKKNLTTLNIFLFIALFYIAFLILYQNFPTYLLTNNAGLAVQGRYIFPVILPLTATLIWGVIRITPWERVNQLLLILLIGFMIYGDYIYFNLEVTSELVY